MVRGLRRSVAKRLQFLFRLEVIEQWLITCNLAWIRISIPSPSKRPFKSTNLINTPTEITSC